MLELTPRGINWGVGEYQDYIDVRQVTQNLSKQDVEKLRLKEDSLTLIERYKAVYPLEFSCFFSLFTLLLVLVTRKRNALTLLIGISALILLALIIAYARVWMEVLPPLLWLLEK